MKKLLVILSIIFIEACSDGDIGGYTESIIKGAKASEAYSAHAQDKPATLNKYVLPLDEDLSGLDEDELREKLLNTYPWPKAEGIPEPTTSSSFTNTSSSSAIVLYENTLEMPHTPYDGVILKYSWKNIAPSFMEAPNYPYGFDRDPTDKDPVIYISVKENEKASFLPYIYDGMFDEYSLLHESNTPLDLANDTKRISLTHYKKTELAHSGTYYLYGRINKGNKSRWYKNEKRIKVIPYSEVTKNIIYVELNGDERDNLISEADKKDLCTTSDYEKCNGEYSRCCVKKYFKDVYKQAVMNVNIIKEPANKYDINELIDVIMTSPDDLTDKIYGKAIEIRNKSNALKKDNSEKLIINDEQSPYWHIVFAINKEKKIWMLGNCLNKNHDLNSCQAFRPEQEPAETKYTLYDICNDGAMENGTQVEIRVKQSGYGRSEQMHYYIYIAGEPFPYPYNDCQALATDNGIPVLPSTSGISGGTEAASFSMKDYMFEDYLPYGSVVFAQRSFGQSGYYILMHELGHSFGLTDVSSFGIYKINEKDKDKKSGFLNKNGVEGIREYENQYASAETNLMSWTLPVGKKLRYRQTPIACTGGTKYYTSIKDNKYVNLIGAIEREIPDGYEQNQWECLRGKCYESEFYTPYFMNPRIQFWNKTDRCEDNIGPNGKKDAKRQRTTQKIFYDLYDSAIINKIINKDENGNITDIDKNDLI